MKTRILELAERAAVRELVKPARVRGEDLTSPEGLLKSMTQHLLEAALEEGMIEHPSHVKQHALAEGRGNIRNGTRSKTVLTDAVGEVTIEAPRGIPLGRDFGVPTSGR